MNKAYKFRLYPNKEQQILFDLCGHMYHNLPCHATESFMSL